MNQFFPRIELHKGKERSVLNFHPWIFSGAIKKQPAGLVEGDIVEVWTADNVYAGTGHFHAGTITVRIFSFTQTKAERKFWYEKIKSAFEYRKKIGLAGSGVTNVYRLVHAEGDGLPGLIIDIFDKTAVIQSHTIGMWNARNDIAAALKDIYKDEINAIFDKSAESLKKQNQQNAKNEFLLGNADLMARTVTENGLQLYIDIIEGQKTGFFVDQRDNRQLLLNYARGRTVLNTFCYSGGFSVYALAGGAALVHSVDSSKKAIEQTDRNVALNFPVANHMSFVGDVFDFFRQSASYDVIILDPPAFAKHLSAVKNAMTGYRKLNYEALQRIASGGMLFTFSCSQAIDTVLFRKLVFQAAAQAKRNVRIMHQLSQPPDHPVSIYHPEGEYLKGLVLYIE